jgi:DNA-binding response OmpR family regulator
MKHQRILIVDDDLNIIMFIQANLEATGYESLTAKSGSEALNTIRNESPDLVILDLMLLDMDGLEVCRLIREFSQVPIIVISARGDTGDKRLSSRHGADDYITKPFDITDLLSRINVILDCGGE